MTRTHRLTLDFAVAGALEPEDFETLAARGFKTIINFRPDGEAPGQAIAAGDARLAAAHGLRYIHIPAAKHEVFTGPVVEAARDVLGAREGPVLGTCASGQRAVLIWAAAMARQSPVDQVLHILKAAGFDFNFLRDDLDAQADRARWHAALPVSAKPAPHPCAGPAAARFQTKDASSASRCCATTDAAMANSAAGLNAL